ncbi:MAG: hypothetical protein B5M49_05400, partial [Thermotoga sp. 4484_232]
KPGVPPSEIEDPTIKALVKVERLFGDHLNLTILLKNPNTFFEATSLRKLKELEEKLRNIDGVENVLSVVDVPRFEGFSVETSKGRFERSQHLDFHNKGWKICAHILRVECEKTFQRGCGTDQENPQGL